MISGIKRPNTTNCTKCGMQYSEDDIACPYCYGKSNLEIIEDVHLKHAEALEKSALIGKVFSVIAAVLALLLIVLW